MSAGYVRQLAASQVDGTHRGGVVVVVVVVVVVGVQRGATVSQVTVETPCPYLGTVMSPVWVHFWLVCSYRSTADNLSPSLPPEYNELPSPVGVSTLVSTHPEHRTDCQ